MASDDGEVWDDEELVQALAEALHILASKPIFALLLGEVGRELDNEDGSSSSEEDYDDDYWVDWDRRRRRKRDTGDEKEEDEEDEDEDDHKNADDEKAWHTLAARRGKAIANALNILQRQRGDKPTDLQFKATLKKAFHRARARVMGPTAESRTAPDPRPDLALLASRALGVSRSLVAKAFSEMATRWVGEALYDLLFEDGDDDGLDDNPWSLNWDADVKVNGSFNLASNASSASSAAPSPAPRASRKTSPSGSSRTKDDRDLDLSPTSVAYFFLELVGTLVGLGWGALIVAQQAG